MLNATHTWNTSIVQDGGTIRFLDGDQLVYTAHTPGEAEAYLYGCFIAPFHGDSLETITRDVEGGKSDEAFGDDALELIARERRSRRSN